MSDTAERVKKIVVEHLNVDAEKVKAEMKDGILEVRLGKREQAKPKQITVAVK